MHLKRSGGFGVDGTFENDIDLIAESGCRFANGSGGEFQDGGGMRANGSETPGLQRFLEMDDFAVAIKVKRVNGKAHGEGVDAVGGADPEAAARWEGGGVSGHEPAKTRPVGARDDEVGGEVNGACAVEGVGRRSGHRVMGPSDDRVIGTIRD
jgi:hypothetical protein